MNSAVTEVGDFFTAWVIYRKVLANNYMHHKEIYEAVTRLNRSNGKHVLLN